MAIGRRDATLEAGGATNSLGRRGQTGSSPTPIPGFSSLLASIAHQMSQPLTALRGRLELVLLKGRNLSDYRQAVEKALVGAEKLATLIQSVRELADAYTAPVNLIPVELDTLARQVVDDMVPIAESRAVTLRLNSVARIIVTTDQEKVYQALLKVLDFAILRSPEHSTVHVSLAASSRAVYLTIQDEGEPIPESSIAQLFEAARVSSKHAEAEMDSHWPLVVAGRMLAASGGSLSAENVGKQGFRFHMRMPLGSKNSP